MDVRELLRTLLRAYERAYPEKSEKVREIEEKIDEIAELCKKIGGKCVRVLIEELDADFEVELPLDDLYRKYLELEGRRKELVASLIDERLAKMPESSRERYKLAAEAADVIAEIFSRGWEDGYCPACRAKKLESKLLTNGKWFFCPSCLNVYDEELEFVHRVKLIDVEIALLKLLQ
ncbi:MAG: hypothetical protein ABWW66_05810 [Archaeoglobaceae archaeon]